MDANLIIIGVVLICSVVLIIFLIRRNFKDKNDLLKSMNAEADGPHNHSEREKIAE
jgi:hypothetical protein